MKPQGTTRAKYTSDQSRGSTNEVPKLADYSVGPQSVWVKLSVKGKVAFWSVTRSRLDDPPKSSAHVIASLVET